MPHPSSINHLSLVYCYHHLSVSLVLSSTFRQVPWLPFNSYRIVRSYKSRTAAYVPPKTWPNPLCPFDISGSPTLRNSNCLGERLNAGLLALFIANWQDQHPSSCYLVKPPQLEEGVWTLSQMGREVCRYEGHYQLLLLTLSHAFNNITYNERDDSEALSETSAPRFWRKKYWLVKNQTCCNIKDPEQNVLKQYILTGSWCNA